MVLSSIILSVVQSSVIAFNMLFGVIYSPYTTSMYQQPIQQQEQYIATFRTNSHEYSSAHSELAAPFAQEAPRVTAASGDMRPFGGPRKAPPTGNDDDEGGNTDIELPLSDGFWWLAALAFVYGMIIVRRKRQTI